VRIDRASPIRESDLAAWQDEIAQHFQAEIRIHFVAEEQIVFPAAREFLEMKSLVEDLRNDHSWLRRQFAAAETQKLSCGDVTEFACRLSEHIRKEERQLFERCQQLMDSEALAKMGMQLDQALKDAGQSCALPRNTSLKSGSV